MKPIQQAIAKKNKIVQSIVICILLYNDVDVLNVAGHLKLFLWFA
jgi:hypothetical protein